MSYRVVHEGVHEVVYTYVFTASRWPRPFVWKNRPRYSFLCLANHLFWDPVKLGVLGGLWRASLERPNDLITGLRVKP